MGVVGDGSALSHPFAQDRLPLRAAADEVEEALAGEAAREREAPAGEEGEGEGRQRFVGERAPSSSSTPPQQQRRLKVVQKRRRERSA